MGGILALHWTTFFKSIQLSTVAIGLLTFSTFPVFVTFFEPCFFREKLKLLDISTALVTFLGVVLVVPKFELGNHLTQGVLWGILSGLTYSILSLLNKKYVKDYPSSVIAFYEQISATALLMPFLFIYQAPFTSKDLLLLMLLGVVFTGISHSLFIKSLKHIKTQTAGIVSSLEPIYGIVFAAFLFKELPTFKEVLGGVIILSTVLYSTLRSKG